MDKLIEWLEGTDFFEAPASKQYHCCYNGGLLRHSLNVYDQLRILIKAYPGLRVCEESVIITSLFHDLCKANFYITEKRNRKNEFNQWEAYDYYTINEKFCYGGHGSKSVYILQSFIKLTPEEAIAINCHMSCWDGNKDVGAAYMQTPFAWLVHVADEAATYISEAMKGE